MQDLKFIAGMLWHLSLLVYLVSAAGTAGYLCLRLLLEGAGHYPAALLAGVLALVHLVGLYFYCR